MHKYRNVFVCMHAHVYSPTDSRYTHTEVNVSTYMVQDICRTCYMYPFFFSRIKRGGCIASVCVCMFACLAVCCCIYVYINRKREFFFSSSLTLKHTHIRTQEENSCLHIAVKKGSNEILRILLNADAKVFSAINKVDR